MLTPTGKVFLPVSGLALLVGAIYKITSGDVLGGTLFLMVGAVAFVLAVMLSSVRENEVAPVVAADAPPPGVRGVVAACHGERKIEEHAEQGVGEAGLVQVKAQNVAFAQQEITLKADADVEIRFDNNDKAIQHNIAIFGSDPNKPIFQGDLVTGVATVTYKFHSPPPGTYEFHCQVHPTMKGTVKVE